MWQEKSKARQEIQEERASDDLPATLRTNFRYLAPYYFPHRGPPVARDDVKNYEIQYSDIGTFLQKNLILLPQLIITKLREHKYPNLIKLIILDEFYNII